MPAQRASSVTSMSRRSSGRAASRPPTTVEKAASPFQPSSSAPQSTDTRSPSRSTRAVGRDAVDDLVVDARAEGMRVAGDELEVRDPAVRPDEVLGQGVQRQRGDARADLTAEQLEGLPDEQAGSPHEQQLLGGTAWGLGTAEHQGVPAQPDMLSMALVTRSVTSSTVPMPSIFTRTPCCS